MLVAHQNDIDLALQHTLFGLASSCQMGAMSDKPRVCDIQEKGCIRSAVLLDDTRQGGLHSRQYVVELLKHAMDPGVVESLAIEAEQLRQGGAAHPSGREQLAARTEASLNNESSDDVASRQLRVAGWDESVKQRTEVPFAPQLEQHGKVEIP